MKAFVHLLAVVLLSWSATHSTAQTAPGLIVRLYELDRAVAAIPDLAPDQKPNEVLVVETLDLGEGGRPFGTLQDRFLTDVQGYLSVPSAGSYEFRLVSDDGARLRIGDQLLIDHDGPHGPTPKDGSTTLNPGWHPLHVAHFEGGGGERLALYWKPPGAADFALVPAEQFSYNPRTDRTTAPGTKKIIPPLRRGLPGDGTPVSGIHPGYRVGKPGNFLDKQVRLGRPPVVGIGGPLPAEGQPLVWLPPDPAGFKITNAAFLSSSQQPPAHWVVANGASGSLYRLTLDFGLQGCVLQHSRGLRPGFRELKVGQDESIWLQHSFADSLSETLVPTGKKVFEIDAVVLRTNGLEVWFTQPLDPRCGWDPEDYYVEQWPFAKRVPAPQTQPTPEGKGPAVKLEYFQPRRDGVRHPVKSASVSPDRMRVFLEVDLRDLHIVYLRLLPPCYSAAGERPWATEAWYTLFTLPPDKLGEVRKPPAPEPQNQLTDAEQAAGWQLLFDGQSTDGWRAYRGDTFPAQGWIVRDGCLVHVDQGGGGDLCTVDEFDDFELALEWRISSAGNSGIFFRVDESVGWPWETGPEMQVLDNAEHADGRDPRTSAGSNYALHAPVRDVTQPVGFFNKVRIVARGPHVEYWLNDVKVVEYELNTPEWQALVADSKFKAWPQYGQRPSGRIVLQDHGDQVWYRNIKIRPLD